MIAEVISRNVMFIQVISSCQLMTGNVTLVQDSSCYVRLC
jgi:hypothetical protein